MVETIELLVTVGGTDLEFEAVTDFDTAGDIEYVTAVLDEKVNAGDFDRVTAELGEIDTAGDLVMLPVVLGEADGRGDRELLVVTDLVMDVIEVIELNGELVVVVDVVGATDEVRDTL